VRGLKFYVNIGPWEPSVAQPPLPLQEFLPLQPLSPLLHPPWPLQEFLPLQACFSGSSAACSRRVEAELDEAVEVEFCPVAWLLANAGAAPESNPVIAAVNRSDLIWVFFIEFFLIS
jgi:hypothetical protein